MLDLGLLSHHKMLIVLESTTLCACFACLFSPYNPQRVFLFISPLKSAPEMDYSFSLFERALTSTNIINYCYCQVDKTCGKRSPAISLPDCAFFRADLAFIEAIKLQSSEKICAKLHLTHNSISRYFVYL